MHNIPPCPFGPYISLSQLHMNGQWTEHMNVTIRPRCSDMSTAQGPLQTMLLWNMRTRTHTTLNHKTMHTAHTIFSPLHYCPHRANPWFCTVYVHQACQHKEEHSSSVYTLYNRAIYVCMCISLICSSHFSLGEGGGGGGGGGGGEGLTLTSVRSSSRRLRDSPFTRNTFTTVCSPSMLKLGS